MSETEAARILREYERREREIPEGFYDLSSPANYFAHNRLTRSVLALLDWHRLLPLNGRRIADIGCGTGTWLLEFLQRGARAEDLLGIDLNASRIVQARERVRGATLEVGDASALPLRGGSVDIAMQFTAFSSVLDASMKQAMAAEMLRVIHARGAILWYDLRVDNPRNAAVRSIGLDELRDLFPGCVFDVERVTLAPPIARAVVPHSWSVASVLERIPFLRSHYLVLIRKQA